MLWYTYQYSVQCTAMPVHVYAIPVHARLNAHMVYVCMDVRAWMVAYQGTHEEYYSSCDIGLEAVMEAGELVTRKRPGGIKVFWLFEGSRAT